MNISINFTESETKAVRNLITKFFGVCNEAGDKMDEVSLVTYNLPENGAGTLKASLNSRVATAVIDVYGKHADKIVTLFKTYMELIQGLVMDSNKVNQLVKEIKAEKAA